MLYNHDAACRRKRRDDLRVYAWLSVELILVRQTLPMIIIGSLEPLTAYNEHDSAKTPPSNDPALRASDNGNHQVTMTPAASFQLRSLTIGADESTHVSFASEPNATARDIT